MCGNGTDRDAKRFALFSGGYDSLVSTHRAMENGDADAVIHLDTSTGLPANEQFVRDVCEEFGWELYILPPTLTLKEFALRYGFPKAGSHSWAFRYFKAHALGRFTTKLGHRPEFITGVYRHESDRRFRHVESRIQERDRWNYRSDVWNWRPHQFEDYRQDHGLPENQVAEDLGRSGDCFCWAYESRDSGIIELRSNGYDDHAEFLLDIESEVQDEIGTAEDYCWIGSQGMSSAELRSKKAKADPEQTDLFGCGGCDGRQICDRAEASP